MLGRQLAHAIQLKLVSASRYYDIAYFCAGAEMVCDTAAAMVARAFSNAAALA